MEKGKRLPTYLTLLLKSIALKQQLLIAVSSFVTNNNRAVGL
jgi:hypothetical protein